MRERSPDGRDVSDPERGDVMERLGEDRQAPLNDRRRFDGSMRRQGPDVHVTVPRVDPLELAQSLKTDQAGGLNETLHHHDDERGPAGDHPGVVPELSKIANGFVR
jgi:hypothetical protein